MLDSSEYSASNIRQNQRECFYPLKLTSTFRIVHPANMLPISTILWLGLKVLFGWFIWPGRWIWSAWRHLIPRTDSFLFLCCRRVWQTKYIATLAEIVCLVYCRSFIAVAFIFQCRSATSDHNLIAVAITELVYETKEKKWAERAAINRAARQYTGKQS